MDKGKKNDDRGHKIVCTKRLDEGAKKMMRASPTVEENVTMTTTAITIEKKGGLRIVIVMETKVLRVCVCGLDLK